jgi:general L-amino acid transport system substrate-binding protein
MKFPHHRLVPIVAALAVGSLAQPVLAGKTLDAVKARGEVACGVNTSAPGFAATDSQGRWQGLDVDTCRAVAAAVLGSADKVKFVPLNSQQRFAALQSGEIDILSRNSTWTLTRDASLGIVFAGINYYDGQGFMVPKKLKIDSAKKLSGATVCVQAGTTSEKNVADYFQANGMKYKTVVFDTAEAIQSAFFAAGEASPIAQRKDVQWLPDGRVAPGGCLIEGRDRIVDGRVDTALERLYRRLTYTGA